MIDVLAEISAIENKEYIIRILEAMEIPPIIKIQGGDADCGFVTFQCFLPKDMDNASQVFIRDEFCRQIQLHSAPALAELIQRLSGDVASAKQSIQGRVQAMLTPAQPDSLPSLAPTLAGRQVNQKRKSRRAKQRKAVKA